MMGDELAHTQRMIFWIATTIKPLDINSFITRLAEIESSQDRLIYPPAPFRKMLQLALAAQAFQTSASDALQEP
jgi:hypothetical protein